MRRPLPRPPLHARVPWSTLGLAALVLFTAWRILTPPSDHTPPLRSPDGTKEARLQTIHYYANQPSYKIHWRPAGEKDWRGLYYLPAALPPPTTARIAWSADSERIDLLLDGTSVWHHVFSE